MRNHWRRGLAGTAVAALMLAGCGGDTDEDDPSAAEEPEGEDVTEEDLEDLLGDQDLPDPNEDVENGVYRGNGVVLPVPDGWSLDPAAFAQGIVVAVSEDGSQQFSAQAIDTEAAEAAGQPLDFELLLDNVRQLGDAEVDEEVRLEGAERAHRLTYLDLPTQEEGGPSQSGTIVLAEDGAGILAEFTFGALSEDYDADYESILLEGAGLDPDSEPPAMPPPPDQAPPDQAPPEDQAPSETDDG